MANSKLTPIPEGFKITRCPPGPGPERKPRSNYSLLKEEERALEQGFSGRVEMLKAQKSESELRSEKNAELYKEAFAEARASGATVSQALDEANWVVFNKL